MEGRHLSSIKDTRPEPSSTLGWNLLMIIWCLLLSGSRHLCTAPGQRNMLSHSRRYCLTAVWRTQAWGMHTHWKRGSGHRSGRVPPSLAYIQGTYRSTYINSSFYPGTLKHRIHRFLKYNTCLQKVFIILWNVCTLSMRMCLHNTYRKFKTNLNDRPPPPLSYQWIKTEDFRVKWSDEMQRKRVDMVRLGGASQWPRPLAYYCVVW